MQKRPPLASAPASFAWCCPAPVRASSDPVLEKHFWFHRKCEQKGRWRSEIPWRSGCRNPRRQIPPIRGGWRASVRHLLVFSVEHGPLGTCSASFLSCAGEAGLFHRTFEEHGGGDIGFPGILSNEYRSSNARILFDCDTRRWSHG